LDGGSARDKAATYTQDNTNTTSMPRVGFELMIPGFERAKTVHAFDRAANVIGLTKAIFDINRVADDYKEDLEKDVSLRSRNRL
jgi:hypothetical protein